jgi:hypothetical protein
MTSLSDHGESPPQSQTFTVLGPAATSPTTYANHPQSSGTYFFLISYYEVLNQGDRNILSILHIHTVLFSRNMMDNGGRKGFLEMKKSLEKYLTDRVK